MTPDSSNFPLFQGNPYSFQRAGSAYWRRMNGDKAVRAYQNTTPIRPEHIMTTHRIRKSSTYRFHDSAHNDRKFLIVALVAALILAAVLSGLGLTSLQTFTK